MNDSCFFCDTQETDKLLQNDHCFARWVYEKVAVSEGHLLILPNRHFANYFEASPEELVTMWKMVHDVKAVVDEKYQPDGYNVGVNVNEAGGQSIPHMHIHIIPRYKGDVENPKGGIRCVIPDKQTY